MAVYTDQILIALGLDPSKFKAGLDQAGKATNSFVSGLQKDYGRLAAATTALGLSFAGQIKIIKDFTKAAQEQELAVAKLTSNLKAEQRTRVDSIKALTDQANALQKVTRFSDDQTIAAQAMLASFSLTDDQILKLIPHIQDVSENLARMGSEEADLHKVALAFGKAINTGNTTALKKFGIEVEKSKDGSVDLGKVIDTLSKSSFTGLAVAVGETSAGLEAITKNQINELQETLGGALLPTINQFRKDLIPVIIKISEWASANRDAVLAIIGGGVVGTGLIAALSGLGLVLATFGVAGGPIAIAIIGISALVALIIKLKVETSNLPTTIEDVDKALSDTRTTIESLRKERDKLAEGAGTDAGIDGDEWHRVTFELSEANKELKKLGEQKTKLLATPTPTVGAGVGGGGGGAKPGKFDAALPGDRDFVGPLPETVEDAQRGLAAWQSDFEEFTTAQVDGWQEMQEASAEASNAFIEQDERERAALNDKVEQNAIGAANIALAWGDMFAHILETEKNFAVAFGKATALGLIKVLGAEARKAVAEILIEKVTELGKAAIGAPLSFGATLAATGPIIAAAAIALGAISSIESKYSKQLQGFETGGVLPKTGPYIGHRGEVIFNPRRNTTAELAANLSRAGATRQAAMLRGESGNFNVNAAFNFNGPLNTALDLERAYQTMATRLAHVLGANTG